MGLGLYFETGEGPRFKKTVKTEADVLALPIPKAESDLGYVMKAVSTIRGALLTFLSSSAQLLVTLQLGLLSLIYFLPDFIEFSHWEIQVFRLVLFLIALGVTGAWLHLPVVVRWERASAKFVLICEICGKNASLNVECLILNV